MAISEQANPLERIPPANVAAERAVLGIVLLEGAAVLPKITAALQVPDFYLEANRLIYRAMLDLAALDHAIDPLTVAEMLQVQGALEAAGGPAQLALLETEASILAHLPEYLAMIREKAVRREIIQQSSVMLQRAYEQTAIDGPTLLEEARTELEAIAARAIVAPDVFPAHSLAELFGLELPDPTFHVAGWIPTKGITFLVGDSEAYKSWFATYLGLCIAAGRPIFDRIAVTQSPVLLVSEENGIVEDRRRLDLIARGMGFDAVGLPFYIASETSFSFDDAARYTALRAFCQKHHVRFGIFDSFVRVHRREEKDAGQMNALYMDRMKPLIRDGVDLLLLHHKRKLPAGMHGSAAAAQDAGDNDAIRGSGDLRAAAHAVLFLKTQSRSQVVVRHNKARGFKKQEPYVFSLNDLDSGGIQLVHEGKPEEALDKSAGVKALILEFAVAHPAGFFRDEIHKAAQGKAGRKAVDAMLTALSKDGVPLKREELTRGRGKKHFYTYVSAEPDAREPGDEDSTDDVPF